MEFLREIRKGLPVSQGRAANKTERTKKSAKTFDNTHWKCWGWCNSKIMLWCFSCLRTWGPFLESPKLFGGISGDTILFIASNRRCLEARNFAVILILQRVFGTFEKRAPDYMANFIPGWNFSPAYRAKISARLLKQMLLKSNCRLHREGFSPGRNSARAKNPIPVSSNGPNGLKNPCNRSHSFHPEPKKEREHAHRLCFRTSVKFLMEICVLRPGWNWACNCNNISARWAEQNFPAVLIWSHVRTFEPLKIWRNHFQLFGFLEGKGTAHSLVRPPFRFDESFDNRWSCLRVGKDLLNIHLYKCILKLFIHRKTKTIAFFF